MWSSRGCNRISRVGWGGGNSKGKKGRGGKKARGTSGGVKENKKKKRRSRSLDRNDRSIPEEEEATEDFLVRSGKLMEERASMLAEQQLAGDSMAVEPEVSSATSEDV